MWCFKKPIPWGPSPSSVFPNTAPLRCLPSRGRFDLVAALLYFASLLIARYRLPRIEQSIDSHWTQSSDFSVMINGLPPNATPEGVRQMLGTYKGQAVPIRHVALSHANRVLVLALRDANEAKFELGIMKARATKPAEVAKQEAKVNALFAKVTELRKSRYPCTGHAFCTFVYEKDAVQCRQERQTCTYRHVPSMASSPPPSPDLSRRHSASPLVAAPSAAPAASPVPTPTPQEGDPLLQEPIEVTISRPGEPSDINWLNLEISAGTRRLRGWGSSLICLLLVLVCSAIISFVADPGWIISPVPNPAFISSIGVQLGCSVLCITFNVITFSLVPVLTSKEGHPSRTTEEVMNTARFIFFQCLNSIGALCMFAWHSNTLSDSWYAASAQSLLFGLAGDCLVMVFGLEFLHPDKRVVRWISRKKAKTQREMYYAYEYGDIGLCFRYQQSLKFLIMSMLFSWAFPWMPLFGALSMLQAYWTDKFNILRQFKRPPQWNSILARIVLWFIQPIGLLIHLGGSLFLICTRDRLVSGTSILRDANFWLEIVAMAIIGAVTVALWVKDFVRLFILPPTTYKLDGSDLQLVPFDEVQAKYSLDLYVPPLTKELAKHTMDSHALSTTEVRQQSRFNTLRTVERLRGTSTVTIQPGEALLMEDGQVATAPVQEGVALTQVGTERVLVEFTAGPEQLQPAPESHPAKGDALGKTAHPGQAAPLGSGLVVLTNVEALHPAELDRRMRKRAAVKELLQKMRAMGAAQQAPATSAPAPATTVSATAPATATATTATATAPSATETGATTTAEAASGSSPSAPAGEAAPAGSPPAAAATTAPPQ
eukprot:GAFH01000793.1.p1 GENE.GAFH01000793.1~~GAFH01000793.1.p1  ORF type:complete len:828 (+),score=357.41 GAFH01000793.1:277-2760(+)